MYRSKIRMVKSETDKGMFLWPDKDLQKQFPCTYDFLARIVDDNGECMPPSSIKFHSNDGRLKVGLTAVHEGVIGWLTLDSVLDAWEVIEAALRDGTVDWREDRYAKKPKKPK